jgi:hypothetical protein
MTRLCPQYAVDSIFVQCSEPKIVHRWDSTKTEQEWKRRGWRFKRYRIQVNKSGACVVLNALIYWMRGLHIATVCQLTTARFAVSRVLDGILWGGKGANHGRIHTRVRCYHLPAELAHRRSTCCEIRIWRSSTLPAAEYLRFPSRIICVTVCI